MKQSHGLLMGMPESYYRSPPNFSLTKIMAGFETNSRPYLLKYGAPYHPADAIVRQSFFANKKICKDCIVYINSILPRIVQP